MAIGGRGGVECERHCNQRLAGFWLSGFEHHCAFLISSSDGAGLTDSDTADGHKRRGHSVPDRLHRDAGGGGGGIGSASAAWLLAIFAATTSRYSIGALASAGDLALGKRARHRKLTSEMTEKFPLPLGEGQGEGMSEGRKNNTFSLHCRKYSVTAARSQREREFAVGT